MTFDPLGGRFGVPGRYAVSIAPGMELELKGKPDQIHPDQLALWMAEMEPVLRKVPNARVGFWYDSKKDRTYLDLSIGLDSLDEAKALGARMSQYAIFDSVTKKDINLRYPGKPEGWRPPSPSRTEQEDALIQFGRRPLRQQPQGAGVPGAAPGQLPGEPPGAAGAAGSGGTGDIRGGRTGAGAPGPGRPAGPDGAGLGVLEQGGVGPDGTPFGTYPPPVPYESATDTGGRATSSSAGEASGLTAGRTGASGDWRSALDSALASVQPYGAARSGGERAFDVATGTAGGVASAATAEEDATWQERAKRFALGAAAGSLVGPTARGALGQVAGRSVNTLGAAAGRPAAGLPCPQLRVV